MLTRVGMLAKLKGFERLLKGWRSKSMSDDEEEYESEIVNARKGEE